MQDAAFLAALGELDLPSALAFEVSRRRVALAQAHAQRRRFTYTGPTRSEFAVNGQPFTTRSAGAQALAHAVLNPGVWLRLPRPSMTARAWHAALARVIAQIDEIDCGLADALSTRRERGPGVDLRTIEGRVWIRFTPGPVCITA